MKRHILLFITILVTKVSFGQCLLSPISLDERVNNSTLIVEGKVLLQECFWDDNHQHIYTANIIDVFKVFKGNSANQITITTQGGTVGDEAETAFPALTLSVGDVGIFNCVSSKVNASKAFKAYDCYASIQGFIKYDENVAADVFNKYQIGTDLYNKIQTITKADFQIIKTEKKSDRVAAAPLIIDFSPTTINGGIHSVLTITGSGFGLIRGTSSVSFKNADDGGKTYISPLASQYVSWTDTEIKVEVPANAGTGTIKVTSGAAAISLNTLTVPFAQLNVTNSSKIAFQADHVNQSGTGGYLWHMYSAFDTKPDAKAAFLRAFTNWRCATDVNWAIGDITNVNATAADGNNIIRFDNGTELAPGILGTCYSYYKGCASENVWFVSELDIVFDDATAWNFSTSSPTSSQYDFESVVVHELGHGHQLAHVIDNNDLMNYAISNGASHRAINVNDLACAQNVMKQSVQDNACGPTAMIPIAAGTCDTPSVTYLAVNYAVYPTLFDKTIHVKYIVENRKNVNIALYNSIGLRVVLFKDETQEIGGYDYDFDVSLLNLPHGIYFMQVLIGDKSESTKMLKQL